jgi:hypothetical protein
MSEETAKMDTSTLNTFCKDAVAAGPFPSDFLLVITANTADKDAAADIPLPIGVARPYLTRCGQERVLYHDVDGLYWDILYKVASRKLLSVQPWDGPTPPEPLNTAFCVSTT